MRNSLLELELIVEKKGKKNSEIKLTDKTLVQSTSSFFQNA